MSEAADCWRWISKNGTPNLRLPTFENADTEILSRDESVSLSGASEPEKI